MEQKLRTPDLLRSKMCVRQFYSGVKLAADFISSCENKFVLQCVRSGVCVGGGRCVREGAVRLINLSLLRLYSYVLKNIY